MSLTILYVEDYEPVRQSVKETLEFEGWHVEVCADGLAALTQIESGAHYDLLLLDNELPRMSGIELVRRARTLPHRKQTPIIMVSASEAGREARRAGAQLFLKKPEGMRTLVESIKLLTTRPERLFNDESEVRREDAK
jgi:two-component system chemotaxis response regulator CheY